MLKKNVAKGNNYKVYTYVDIQCVQNNHGQSSMELE